MSWFDWTLLGLWMVGLVASAITVGKPREPYTPAQVAVQIVVTALLVAGLLVTRGVIA